MEAGLTEASYNKAVQKGIIMPKFGVKVPHALTKDEARSRLERFVEMIERRA